MKRRKWSNFIFLTGLLVVIGFTFILFRYGSIDFKGTLATKYHKIENSTDQIIETDFFKLKTPQDWTHLFGGYGTEGDPFGTFQTSKGVIHYEYGPWAPNYDKDNEIYGYSIKKITINRFQINIARNDKGETGICIPMQNEMKSSFTLYLNKSVSNNFNELLNGIKELEFK